MTDETFHLLYIDDFHAGDRLFLQSLARALARAPKRAVVTVHGSGEEAQRTLEAEGIFIERTAGILPVTSVREHALVERAMRRLNQRIVTILTDAVVSSVGVLGSQLRLLQVRVGRVRAGSIDWMLRLLRQGVVPVVGACAVDPILERTGEVPVADAVVALAGALGGNRVEAVFFARAGQADLLKGEAPVADLPFAAAVKRELLPDAEGMQTVLRAGLDVRLTGAADVSGGTRIVL